jgi:hypothetical protein
MHRPIPFEAPVTSATRPERLNPFRMLVLIVSFLEDNHLKKAATFPPSTVVTFPVVFRSKAW